MAARAKLAVVTGASRGIGLAIAEELSRRGFRLFLVGRDQRLLDKLAARLPLATAHACDIRDPESVARLASALRKLRRVDVLINNAGIAGPNKTIATLDFATWRDVVETNLHGTFLVTTAILPLMKKGSVIVNNLSVAARTSFPGMAAYNASKHGLLGFTDTLREELRERKIRVVALLPGATDTAIWKQFWPNAPRRAMVAPATVGRLVAEAVTLPLNANVEELVIRPSAGTL
jgi:3-oxoacyl-[acyl-carrier protein] reductase